MCFTTILHWGCLHCECSDICRMVAGLVTVLRGQSHLRGSLCVHTPATFLQPASISKEGRPCCTELLPRCLRFPTLSDQWNTLLETPFFAAPLYSFISHSHTTRSPQVSCLISQTMQIQQGQLSLEISSWYERWGWEFFLVTLSKCCCF